MADLSDVEIALATTVTQALYPQGIAAPSSVGAECRIYRGWPLPTALTNDLKRGIANVTVFPAAEPGRLTTRFTDGRQDAGVGATLSLAVSGNTVTFGGSGGAGQTVGLVVDGRTYVYIVQAGDTPASVAANLASLARVDYIATLTGSSITIPAAGFFNARVVSDALWRQEIRRQSCSFHIACWCPSAQSRDKIAIAIDQIFASMAFLSFSDGSVGRISYEGTTVTDRGEDVLLVPTRSSIRGGVSYH